MKIIIKEVIMMRGSGGAGMEAGGRSTWDGNGLDTVSHTTIEIQI